MSNFRRHLIIAYNNNKYISNGLVFNLVGEEASSSVWTDNIGGKSFTLTNAVKIDNGVQFTKTSYGIYDGDISDMPDYTESTIEFVYKITSWDTPAGVIFGIKASNKPLVFYSNSENCIKRATAYNITTANFNRLLNVKQTQSINDNYNYINKTDKGFGTLTSYSYANLSNNIQLGNPKYTNRAFIGILYAVRIYNRQLTSDEILHNQHIDINKYGIKI
jgi:hypothetical protein